MSKKIVIITLLLTFLFGTMTYAHSGRTDSSGGHNCSEKSQAKGLCSGYHYHNGGGDTNSTPKTYSNDKDCSDFATYDEVVEYWNLKGYSATYDPESLDGWGNGQVDDGIPCEAPSGYDKTKINNSPEQIQYKKEQQDITSGETQGYVQGISDGYQEVTQNNVISNGTDAFNQGYKIGYNKGYEEGKNKIEAEKVMASDEGYALGKKQDKIAIPNGYNSHQSLKKAFEDGFKRAQTEQIFSDVPATLYSYDKIMFLLENGVISESSKFGLNDIVTREEVAVMIAKAVELDGTPRATKFSDVHKSNPNSGYIQSAVEAGIIFGVSDTKFDPNAKVTRGQMATFISRAYDLPDSTKTFKDVPKSDYFYEAVGGLVAARIASGYPDGTFKPYANLTREHIAIFIVQSMKFATGL